MMNWEMVNETMDWLTTENNGEESPIPIHP